MATVVKSVELSTGVRLEYVERGSRRGVPVLLLHGITDSWHSFEPVLPYLPESVRAFALTARGHGDAERPEEGYTPAHFAADAAAFLDAVGVEAAVIVGHSMGSFVAQRFALDFPERTLGLVLAGSFATGRGNVVLREFCATCIATLEDPIDPEFARSFQLDTLARPVEAAFLDLVVAESLKVPARVWRAAFEGFVDADHSPELGSLDAPTLVVCGERDAFFPRVDQEALARAIPGSRFVLYEGAGHALHWEEPARFAGDVAEFGRQFASGAWDGGSTSAVPAGDVSVRS
jgi:pimeloyl-ACP methyl ester carboxylesterase